MGPWLADTISRCDGKTQMMSYWTFSDVFDEQGVVKTPFYGGFGIVAEDGIPKPAYNAFMLLDKLGDVRLPAPTDEALVTRRADGTLVIAAWNWVEPEVHGSDKTVTFDFSGVADGVYAEVRRVDAQHGDTLDAWKKMGSPAYPTVSQVTELRKASEIGPPEAIAIRNHQLTLAMPPMGLAVVEIR
jgi:xylan 1,4-beta-xylosidase